MQLLSAGNILRLAWAQYTKHFKAYREPLLWVLAPAVLSSLLPIIPGATEGTALLLGIIGMVIAVWAAVQIIDIAWALYEGKAPPSALTTTLAWGPIGRIVDYALISILYALIVIAGFFLLIIPGVLFATWFAFAPLVTLIEGAHGTGALKRSKELVHGRFWSIFWRWFVINFFPALAHFVIIAVLVLVDQTVTGTLTTPQNMDGLWWINVVSNVITVLIMPFILTSSVILFAEARKTK